MYRKIHWSGPVLIIVPFILGVCTAIAHHVLHASFDAKWVINDIMQQWLLRISTGLAFITNFFFVFSASTSYVQWFWYQFRQSRLKLNEANALFGILADLSRFFRSSVWWKTPIITVLAIIVWMLPVAVVFPPGTITVHQANHTSFEQMDVVESNFEKPSLAARVLGEDLTTYSALTPPTSEQLYASAMTSGRILTVPHERSSANVSYHVNFYGPALSCSVVKDQNVKNFVDHAIRELEDLRETNVSLIGFFPDSTFGPKMNSSAFIAAANSQADVVQFEAYCDFISPDVSRFYVWNALGNGTLKPTNQIQHSTCGFYNASYTVHFNLYSSGAQSVEINTNIQNPIALKDYLDLLPESTPASPEANTIRSYFSLIYTFGSDVTGGIFFTKEGGDSPTFTYPLEAKTLQRDVISGGDTYTNFLQEAFRNITVSARYGLAGPNFGLSHDALWARYGPSLSNVTTNASITIQQNDFHYKPRALFISYALSTFGTAICLCFGLYAIYRNEGSFSNDFSTLLRIARTQLDIMDWDEGARAGYDPLPKSIGRILTCSMEPPVTNMEEVGDDIVSNMALSVKIKEEFTEEVISCTSPSSEKEK